MDILLAFIQFGLIAVICTQEVKRKSPAIFLWATLMVMFGVMHTLSVLTGNSEYKTQTLNEASLFVIGFCGLYLFTRNLICVNQGRQLPILTANSIENDDNRKPLLLLILFVSVSFMMCYKLISFSGSLLDTSWSTGRDYSASLNYANSNQIYNILYFSLSGLPLYFWIKNEKKSSILCILAIVLVTIITRNRILVLPALVFVLALYIIKIENLRIKHLVFAAIAGILVIYIVYGLRVFRHYGTIEVFLREFNCDEFFAKINLYIATDNGELGLRNDFYFFVEHNNQFQGFGKWASYIRMFLVYLPTKFSFGLKPDDFAQTMGSAVGMVVGGSTHPTLFGDCYANAGIFGVLLGVFWAMYSSISDSIIRRCKNQVLKTLVYCLFAVTFVIIGRGSVYNSFFFVAWGVPVLWIIIKIIEKLLRIKIKIR